MKYEASAGAIIWKQENNELRYLIVKNVPRQQFNGLWAFPKGHLENDETNKQAAQREVFEEVGLKPDFNFDFKQSFSYQSKADLMKTVTLFLAKHHQEQEIQLQASEISAALWLPYDEAKNKISSQTFKEFNSDDLVRILTLANDYLQTH